MDDETIGSYVQRVSFLRQESSRLTARTLGFGKANLGYTPVSLARLAATLPPPYTERYLLARHTLRPLIDVFEGGLSHRIGRDPTTGSPAEDFHLAFRYPLSTGVKYRVLRRCDLCADLDRAEFGFTYWHRSHQIAEITSCWRHGTQLFDHCSACGNRHTVKMRATTPFSCLNCGKPLRGHSEPKDSHAAEFRLAKIGREILDSRHPTITTAKFRTLYFTKFYELGPTDLSRLQRPRIGELIAERYDEGSLDRMRTKFVNVKGTQLNSVAEMFHNERPSTRPIIHIILIEFLFGSFQQFLSRLNGFQHVETFDKIKIISETAVTRHITKRPRLDLSEVLRLHGEGNTLPEVAKLLKVDREFVMDLRRQHRRAFNAKNHTTAKIEANRPTYRQRMLDVLSGKVKTLQPSNLKLLKHWLEKHDAEWYRANIAADRPSEEERLALADVELAERIHAAGKHLLRVSPPVWICIALISEHVQVSDEFLYRLKHKKQYPLAQRALLAVRESSQAFMARRKDYVLDW